MVHRGARRDLERASAATKGRSHLAHLKSAADFALRVRDSLVPATIDIGNLNYQQAHSDESGRYFRSLDIDSFESMLDGWENEGGSFLPPLVSEARTPILTTIVRHYHVGQYVYDDLSLAMKEHERQRRQRRSDRLESADE